MNDGTNGAPASPGQDRPSAKALGKRRMVDVYPDSAMEEEEGDASTVGHACLQRTVHSALPPPDTSNDAALAMQLYQEELRARAEEEDEAQQQQQQKQQRWRQWDSHDDGESLWEGAVSGDTEREVADAWADADIALGDLYSSDDRLLEHEERIARDLFGDDYYCDDPPHGVACTHPRAPYIPMRSHAQATLVRPPTRPVPRRIVILQDDDVDDDEPHQIPLPPLSP